MSQDDGPKGRLPKGVAALPRARGGRGYRASIRKGKGGEVHLGLYETPWLASYAYQVAARLLGRDGGMPVAIPQARQPTAEQVRAITGKVRRRLGLDAGPRPREESPPEPDELRTMFEITVVGFWRGQAAEGSYDRPDAGLDAAARRLVEAARLLFWRRSPGYPDPLDAMADLLGRRIDAAFRRADLTRAVLDDDGDDPDRVARWLVHPDASPSGRGFREEIRHLYDGLLGDGPGEAPGWAAVLGLAPPFTPERVRSAYRARSREAHPDVGGTIEAFVRLREAYERALAYCASRMG